MDRLAEIRERCEAATDRPWEADAHYVVGQVSNGRPGGEVIMNAEVLVGGDRNSPSQNIANAEFAAHSRQDIPWLLEQLAEINTVAASIEKKSDRLAQRIKEVEAIIAGEKVVIAAKEAEIERLEAECFKLSAGCCVIPDSFIIVEGESVLCKWKLRADELRKALEFVVLPRNPGFTDKEVISDHETVSHAALAAFHKGNNNA